MVYVTYVLISAYALHRTTVGLKSAKAFLKLILIFSLHRTTVGLKCLSGDQIRALSTSSSSHYSRIEIIEPRGPQNFMGLFIALQ